MTPEDWLEGLAGAEVPGHVTRLMRLCLMDWAACAKAGQGEPVAAVIGPAGEDAARRALVWGTQGHALDFDDTHFGHIGHTSAVVMPALLALAGDRPMVEVLEAAAVGSEAALRVGLWLGRAHYQVGFHQTATSGAVGAAVGAARLLSLEAARLRHALGLAATAASGLKGQFGTMGKPLNAGLAARVAVESVLWAREGMTSDPAGLSGPQGFGATHHGEGRAEAFEGPDWQITGVSHKFHACCHGLHAMLEALREAPRDVVRVTVHTHPRWLSVCNQPAPDTGLGVKFSYRHTAAMALRGRDTGDSAVFTDETARDPVLMEWRERVDVLGDDSVAETATRVVLTRENGSEVTLTHDLARPMPLDAREARLTAKVATLLREAETLVALTRSDSAKALADWLQRP